MSRVVLGLMTVAGLAVAPAANAGTPGPTESLGSAGGVEYLKAKFESVASQAGAPAECDAGDYILGGGGSINGDPSSAELSVLAPTDSPGGWLAKGASTDGARRVTTYGICGNEATQLDTATASFAAGQEFNSGEECVAGDVSLSGGVSAGNGDTTIAAIRPDFQVFDWTNRFAVESNDTVSRHIVCTSQYSRTVRAATATVRKATAAKVVRRCGSGDEALGGGFEVDNDQLQLPYEVHAITSKPWDDPKDANKVPEDGWLAKVYNDTGAKLELKTFAVCGA